MKQFVEMTLDELRAFRESGASEWFRPSTARSVHTGTLADFEFNAPTPELCDESLEAFKKSPDWRLVDVGPLTERKRIR